MKYRHALADRLRERWRAFLERAEGDVLVEPYDCILVPHYQEPWRYYHTLAHVEACLNVFEALVPDFRRYTEVEAAIWLHDVIYHPKQVDNEARSARVAEGVLREVRMHPMFIQNVQDLIMDTRHPSNPDTLAGKYLVDVDLSILGESELTFGRYEAEIRAEYGWVPERIFRERRAEVLRSFLDRPSIYFTPEFRSVYEGQARTNLGLSLRVLEAGV